jgi:predicted regulator of Ras-like GTPase activity (Roadblock/LC7/MglB family)
VPFQYLLTNLVVDVPGAQGAIFVDPEGEAVDFVARRTTPYELKLEGAYHGIFLRRAGQLARLVGGGDLTHVTIMGRKMQAMGLVLAGGYYLVLMMEPGAPPAVAVAAMRRTADALNQEIA